MPFFPDLVDHNFILGLLLVRNHFSILHPIPWRPVEMGHAVALLTGPNHGLGAVGHGSAADPVPDLDFLTVLTETNNVPQPVL